ncbi:rhodanese-like domain-containing protein [[Eubacterium] cellulosolvens]
MATMKMKKIVTLAFVLVIVGITIWIETGLITQNQITQPQKTPEEKTTETPFIQETIPSPEKEVKREDSGHSVVTPPEAFNLISKNKNNSNFVILDVRTPEEFAEGHIENAINIDYYMDERSNNTKSFRDELGKLDRNKTYLIYCLADIRSSVAMNMMKHLGFKEVYDMSGGIVQWQAEELPVVK